MSLVLICNIFNVQYWSYYCTRAYIILSMNSIFDQITIRSLVNAHTGKSHWCMLKDVYSPPGKMLMTGKGLELCEAKTLYGHTEWVK